MPTYQKKERVHAIQFTCDSELNRTNAADGSPMFGRWPIKEDREGRRYVEVDSFGEAGSVYERDYIIIFGGSAMPARRAYFEDTYELDPKELVKARAEEVGL